MPIDMILSTELRVVVPTVGGIQLVTFKEVVITQKIIFTVMLHNLSWLILTLDKSSTGLLTTTRGLLGGMNNSCSYSPQESP